jgi:hypothetical protein
MTIESKAIYCRRVSKETSYMYQYVKLMLFRKILYLGGCAAAAGGGMAEWRKMAVVGTTVVEEWVGYQYQAFPLLMLGHYPNALNLATTEKEQSLLHSPKPARTDISHARHMTDVLQTQPWHRVHERRVSKETLFTSLMEQ